jgi:hypothetical protein
MHPNEALKVNFVKSHMCCLNLECMTNKEAYVQGTSLTPNPQRNNQTAGPSDNRNALPPQKQLI